MIQMDTAGLGAPARGVLNLSDAMAKARGEDFLSKYKWYLIGGAVVIAGGFLLLRK